MTAVTTYRTKDIIDSLVEGAKFYKHNTPIAMDVVPRSKAERQQLKQINKFTQDNTIINIQEMFRNKAAFGPHDHPKVAIAFWRWETVRCLSRVFAAACPFYFCDAQRGFRYSFHDYLTVKDVEIREPAVGAETQYSLSTAVPLIPNRFKHLVNRKTFILFDTPKWTVHELPSVDPYLLHRIDKDNFKIVAHWDLTENEKRLVRLVNI